MALVLFFKIMALGSRREIIGSEGIRAFLPTKEAYPHVVTNRFTEPHLNGGRSMQSARQYIETNISRLPHVFRRPGSDTPRDHSESRHGNRR